MGLEGAQHKHFRGLQQVALLSRGKINISNIDIVIIHVGTNNISSAQNVDTIISYYGDLIHKLKYKTNAHIICTSILPRLCDHDKIVNKINKVNLELKKICIRKKIQYSNLYRSFFLLNNRPDSSLYAPRDGLHLNFAGTFKEKVYKHYQTYQCELDIHFIY